MLPTLQPNDQVRMQVQSHWIPAVVVKEAGTPHSYIVRTRDGRNYRRNRKHLRKSTTQANDLTFDTADDFEIPAEPNTSSEPNEPGIPSPALPSPALPPPDRQTQRGRTVRIPARYQDFVRL